jgi:hypothetical protein
VSRTALDRLRREYASAVGEASVLGCMLAAHRTARHEATGVEDLAEVIARGMLERMTAPPAPEATVTSADRRVRPPI